MKTLLGVVLGLFLGMWTLSAQFESGDTCFYGRD